MQWKVGVLRTGSENIAWTELGDETDWPSARVAALAAMRTLAEREGRSEYHVHVDDVSGISRPGLDESGAGSR